MRSETCKLFGVFIFALTYVNAQQGSSCTTPNGERGRCISIYACDVLYNVVTSRNRDQLNFIRSSQCGYGSDPLVCCGSDNNFRQRTPSPTKKPPGRRVDNINLLPNKNSCGIQTTIRILDGEATGIDEFPWMALLQYRNSSGFYKYGCGGALISSRYVLTAAHCVTGQVIKKLGGLANVILGEYNTQTREDCIRQDGFEACNDAPVNCRIDETVPHPDYSDNNINRYNDIALIRLDRDVTFTDFVRPICLPEPEDVSNVGQPVSVAGWGKTERANASPVKLKVKIPVAQKSLCASTFRMAGVTLSDNQICAGGERGRDSCTGDSGGPLMTTTKRDSSQWYVEGIVSFGARCGTEGWPGIYTKVQKYNDWIRSNIRR